MKKFNISTNVFFGENSLSRLNLIENKRVAIITDKFMNDSGVVEKIVNNLTNCQVFIFDKVLPDPSIEIVSEGVAFVLSSKPEILIALGGGSPLDAAKAIREFAHKLGYLDIKECFAIPTTSGTGSEVTKFSVITDSKKGVKYPLISEELEPMVAILDPSLITTVPQNVTADTGMDALSHALEAYVSTESTDFTDALAEKAITMLFKFLPMSYADGNNLYAREKVHNASCIAGMAFNTAGLGICHSIAHAIGGKFHISHGRCNSILLPHIIRFNAGLDYQEETVEARKYKRIAKLLGLPYFNTILGVNSLIKAVSEMNNSFKIPTTFRTLGVTPEDYNKYKSELIQSALSDVCTKTNPRGVSASDIERILSKSIPF